MNKDFSGAAVIRPPSRYTEYSDELATEICLRVASGQSLRTICLDPEMPCRDTIWRWSLDDEKGFAKKFERARLIQAHGYVDEIMDIADGDGDFQHNRLRVDTRKWYASKVIPKIYGDRQIHQTQDEDGDLHPLNIGLINVPPKVPTDD